jgi:hypothetical protein
MNRDTWRNLVKNLPIYVGFLAIAGGSVTALTFAGKDLLYAIPLSLIYILLVVCHQISKNNPHLRTVWEAITYVPRNLWLWVMGNVRKHQMLNDIHRWTLASQEASLFGKLAEMNGRVDNYHIFFSHKGVDRHPQSEGGTDNYQLAGFPYDEAELILRVSSFASNNLNLDWSNIQIRCSCDCAFREKPDFKNFDFNRIPKGAMTIVGSPKENELCGALMAKIRDLETRMVLKRPHKYTMEINTQNVSGEHRDEIVRSCYLKGHGDGNDNFIPDSTNTIPSEDKIMTDYAMLMKLPNLFSGEKDRNKTIMLFAGCRVAGQVALTDWISNPAHLVDLVNQFSTKYFYSIFLVKYHFIKNYKKNLISTRLCEDRERKPIQGEITIDWDLLESQLREEIRQNVS